MAVSSCRDRRGGFGIITLWVVICCFIDGWSPFFVENQFQAKKNKKNLLGRKLTECLNR
jgi:hypothetical protein